MDVIYDTLPPGAISEELAPVIQSLGLTRHCEELATNGWTVIEGMATAAFNDRLRTFQCSNLIPIRVASLCMAARDDKRCTTCLGVVIQRPARG